MLLICVLLCENWIYKVLCEHSKFDVLFKSYFVHEHWKICFKGGKFGVGDLCVVSMFCEHCNFYDLFGTCLVMFLQHS